MVIDKEMMKIMVADFLADHDEMDDLVLYGDPYIDEFGDWAQDAYDNKTTYTLVAVGEAELEIH